MPKRDCKYYVIHGGYCYRFGKTITSTTNTKYCDNCKDYKPFKSTKQQILELVKRLRR